jgi:hypothetical protein
MYALPFKFVRACESAQANLGLRSNVFFMAVAPLCLLLEWYLCALVLGYGIR